jgi:hypothetical protein
VVENDDILGDGVNVAARARRLGRAGRHLRFGPRAGGCCRSPGPHL